MKRYIDSEIFVPKVLIEEAIIKNSIVSTFGPNEKTLTE